MQSLLLAAALGSPHGLQGPDQPAQAMTIGDVLSRARAAVGWEAFSPGNRGYVITGTAKVSGLDSAWSFTFDGKRYIEQIEGTGAGLKWLSIEAHDGTTAWKRDWGGVVSKRDLSDLEQGEVIFDLRTYRWLNKEQPFEFKMDDAVSTADFVSMTWTKRFGASRGTVKIDRKTWLASEFTRETSAGSEVWIPGDYREFSFEIEGRSKTFKVPMQWTRSSAGLTDLLKADTFKPRETTTSEPYAFSPVAPPVELTASPAPIESKWVRQGLVLVNPKVNGKDIGWFILDSGAGSLVIDTKAAKEAGLPEFGQVAAVGIGGAEKATWFKASSFELGQVRIPNIPMAGINLGTISLVLGVKCAGICGWDLFSRSVVELDVSGQKVAVAGPNSYAGDGLSWNPLRFSDNHPVLVAKFEGDRSGLFRLDTGANNTVTFHGPAVKKFELLQGRKTRRSALGGVGGATPAEVGELTYFELGGKRFDKAEATFATSDRGPLGDPYLVGNIGQGFLKPFKVVLDYPRARIAFVERL